MDSMKRSSSDFAEIDRLIVLVDLPGSTKAFQARSDLEMAAFLQEFYEACEAAFTASGGTVIKFMGDTCLAVFPPDETTACVDAVDRLRTHVASLDNKYGVPIGMGANLHIARVVEGTFGVGASRRTDVVGRGVNQTFLLGRGSGIRLSEPVYRDLPSDRRTPWRKHKPPAIYVLENADGASEGLEKSPSANAQRW